MAATRSIWTDSRLDDLNVRVKGIEVKVDAGFARLDDRIDKLNHNLVQGLIALIAIIAVLLSVLVTIVATHG
jgi:hypothetical protein